MRARDRRLRRRQAGQLRDRAAQDARRRRRRAATRSAAGSDYDDARRPRSTTPRCRADRRPRGWTWPAAVWVAAPGSVILARRLVHEAVTPSCPAPEGVPPDHARPPLPSRARHPGAGPSSGVDARGVAHVPAPAGLGIMSIGVPEGSELELDLRLESVIEGVLVSGTARVQLTGECSRCLDPIVRRAGGRPAGAVRLRGDRLARRRVAQRTATRTTTTSSCSTGDLLDLEPVLRDAVVLALPLAPVCRDDCPGLCAAVRGPPRGRPGAPARRGRPAVGRTLPDWSSTDDARPYTRREGRGLSRGRPEAEDLAQQHPPPPLAVEGQAAADQQGACATAASSPSCPHRVDADGEYNGRQVLDV